MGCRVGLENGVLLGCFDGDENGFTVGNDFGLTEG